MNQMKKRPTFVRRFFRWLFRRQTQGRALVVLAALATLVAAFYLAEDWRGKRAWENCKRELEAQGVVLDWDKYIPPPVPDDQNFFKASPRIAASFIKARSDAEGELARQVGIHLGPMASNTFSVFDSTKASPLVVARLTILTPDVKPASVNTNIFFKLNDPAASDQIGKLIQKTAGQSANGSQGFPFSEMQLSNLVPAQIFVVADSAPSISDLESFIPPGTATNIGRLQIVATVDKGVFEVALTGVHITSAADYLEWSDQYASDFDEIREALKRPYAIIPGDYSEPYQVPIQNFVMMRSLAQTLAQRTQCYLLLGQPDKALRELTLMHDICRILERPPTGKPITLVEAMINVAISGLYAATVAEGMRLHLWQESQLAALQEQLKEINLPSKVGRAFESEPAATAHTLENISTAKLKEWFQVSNGKSSAGTISLWQKIRNLKWALIPHGWIYQNMATSARLVHQQTEGCDSVNGLIQPQKFGDSTRELNAIAGPYKFIAVEAIPNFAKAWQTTAHNQTMVNQAQIVCALERYHLAHGEYPETLDALTPQFIEKLPHDIIGGQPLHYRHTDDGRFLLYSVGWNEKDDGGTPGTLSDVKTGDWVWQHP